MSTSAALARRASSPGRHVYDAIVFGSQLSGVLTAATLAKRGLQVLLLDHDGLSSPYVHGDFSYPHAPFFLPAIEHVPALDSALSEIGITTQVKRMVQPVGLQLLRPRQWLELSATPAARATELTRALGAAGAEALTLAITRASKGGEASEPFFQARPDLPADGWFNRWKLRRFASRFSGLDVDCTLDAKDPHQALLLSLWPFFASARGPLARARTLSRAVPTLHTFPGGREGLSGLLLDRARELGVDVLDGEHPIELLALEGKTVVGVRLRKSDTVYRAGAVVAACDLQTLAPLIPDARRAPLEQLTPRVTVKKAVMTAHTIVPERALPRGLGPFALIEGLDAELGPVLVTHTAARRGTLEAPERLLSFSAHVDTGLRDGGEPAVQALVARLWASVADVLPFTRAHALAQSTPWTDSQRVVAGVAEPLPTFELPADSVLGVAALTTRTPWGRLFNASRQVLPGLGLEGEVLAAQRAVSAVEKLLKKKDPLREGRPA